MLAMPVRSAHWRPDPRGGSDGPTPAPSALLAGARSRSRQLLVILRLIHHLPCPPSLLHEEKERRRASHLPKTKLTEKVPPLLSRILRTPRVLRKDAEQVSKCTGIGFQGSGPRSPTELPVASWLSLPLFPSKLIPRTSSILAGDTAPTPHPPPRRSCLGACKLHRLSKLHLRKRSLRSEGGHRFIYAALTHLHIGLYI